MHIVLGVLGTVVTILILLNRLADAGIDLGGLNPFLWARKRQWRKKYYGNPIYNITSPMETAALLMTAVAKVDGDMSFEEKKLILACFQEEFHLPKRDAAGLLIYSAHILGTGEELRENLEKVIQPSLDSFTDEQAQSTLQLLERVRQVDPADNELKSELIDRVKTVFSRRFQTAGKWH